MELKFKGKFHRDIDINDRKLLEEIKVTILNVKNARSKSQIPHLKKLRKYKTYYRIKIFDEYRIGVVIRNNVVWFAGFGHRSVFYKNFP